MIARDEGRVYVIGGDYVFGPEGAAKLIAAGIDPSDPRQVSRAMAELDRPIDELAERRRPAWPYTKCPECQHDFEEHDEDGRCHTSGCECGMNRG